MCSLLEHEVSSLNIAPRKPDDSSGAQVHRSLSSHHSLLLSLLTPAQTASTTSTVPTVSTAATASTAPTASIISTVSTAVIALPTVFDRNPTVQSDFEVLPEDLELIEKVGSGAYGQVWRGVWKGKGGGVDVAVKIVEALGRTEQQQAKAFGEVGILTHSHSECTPIYAFLSPPAFCFLFFVFLTPLYILMRLKHPYIMTIYGTCTVQKQLWIVMKYIDGKSLFDLLHSTEEISWEWRLRYTPNH